VQQACQPNLSVTLATDACRAARDGHIDSGGAVTLAMLHPIFATVHHGLRAPLLWVIGIVLIVAGVIGLFRGSLILGIILIIVGVVIGGLNIL
jgi:hypothetical protein